MKYTTKPKPVSRATSSPRLRHDSLQALRVRTWYYQVLQAAIPKQLAQFETLREDYLPTQQQLNSVVQQLGVTLQNWINQSLFARPGSTAPVLTVSSRHVGYFNGTTEPRVATLDAFDQLVPGSKLVYDSGLWDGNLPISKDESQSRLPAWAILDGHRPTCAQYLIDLIPPQEGMSYVGDLDKLQCLLDCLTTAKSLTSVTELPDLGYVQKQAHPVWLSHLERHTPAAYIGKGVIAAMLRQYGSDTAIDDNRSTGYEYPSVTSAILGVIAMWWLFDEPGYEYALEIEWVMVGLCYGVIAYHFSLEVQEFLLQQLRLRGEALDRVLRSRSPEILPYDERWKTVIQIGR